MLPGLTGVCIRLGHSVGCLRPYRLISVTLVAAHPVNIARGYNLRHSACHGTSLCQLAFPSFQHLLRLLMHPIQSDCVLSRLHTRDHISVGPGACCAVLVGGVAADGCPQACVRVWMQVLRRACVPAGRTSVEEPRRQHAELYMLII